MLIFIIGNESDDNPPKNQVKADQKESKNSVDKKYRVIFNC